ncbi:hypothetical protein EDB81DRAFT_197216 [Dactylonectria macrodidyma]|uniref:Uncharacterized protein n=1 Tax=Dactylonectria macrodidyma TaxID=307937 RepID=A0A9P9FRQ8_9HYPO|nr:hypothetical protein EDB81DRAFT_197216 [Dactylonectria macrodidyma]
MASLLDLPPELLLQTCTDLLPPFAHGSIQHIANTPANRALFVPLSNLSRTCPVLRQLAQQMLYRRPLPARCHFVNFVLTLCQRPDLAQKVQVLNLDVPWDTDPRPIIPPQDVAIFDQALARCERARIEFEVSLFRQSGKWPKPRVFSPTQWVEYMPLITLSALALAQITNVVRLEVGGFGRKLCYFCCAPGSLPRLAELHVKHRDEEKKARGNLDRMDELLEATPALRVFAICQMGNFSVLPRHDNIVEVRLTDNNLDGPSLERIMGQFKNLQIFSYQAAQYPRFNEQQASPWDVFRALLMRAATLRHVSISFRSIEVEPLHRSCAMASLKDMLVLESLQVDVNGVFVGNDFRPATLVGGLPPSVYSVRFKNMGEDFLQEILQLAEKAPGGFPNLRDVAFDGLEEESWVTVRRAFAAVGVETHVDTASIADGSPAWISAIMRSTKNQAISGV